MLTRLVCAGTRGFVCDLNVKRGSVCEVEKGLITCVLFLFECLHCAA